MGAGQTGVFGEASKAIKLQGELMVKDQSQERVLTDVTKRFTMDTHNQEHINSIYVASPVS